MLSLARNNQVDPHTGRSCQFLCLSVLHGIDSPEIDPPGFSLLSSGFAQEIPTARIRSRGSL